MVTLEMLETESPQLGRTRDFLFALFALFAALLRLSHAGWNVLVVHKHNPRGLGTGRHVRVKHDVLVAPTTTHISVCISVC